MPPSKQKPGLVQALTPEQGALYRNIDQLANWTPRQAEANAHIDNATALFILYGGARGGGKSRWLRWKLLKYVAILGMIGVPKPRVGLFCETYPDLMDRQASKIELEFPPAFGSLKENRSTGYGFHLNKELGGGVLALRNLDDPTKYQSAEFAAIGVDELTKNPKTTFDILRGSLRWPGLKYTPFLGATNPGGIGHRWVKDLWIDRNFRDYQELEQYKKQFAFVQSLPVDNPHLDKTYWQQLNSLPPMLAKAWVYGDWDVFQGQAFPGYSDRTHMLPAAVNLPEHWPRWRAVDWGFAAPFVCLWLCKDPDRGRIFVYRMIHKAGLTDVQQARLIRELTPPNEQISITYADPSMWSRTTLGDQVASSADTYAAEGVPLTKGDNNRLSGKRKVDQVLTDLADGRPGLLLFPECANLGKTLANLAYDETNIEDVDTDQDDHDYDALKYGLTNVKEIYMQPEQREPDTSPMQLAQRRGVF